MAIRDLVQDDDVADRIVDLIPPESLLPQDSPSPEIRSTPQAVSDSSDSESADSKKE